MRKYHVREYSDKLGRDFKTIVLAEYDIDAETIVNAERLIDAQRHHETKSISVFNAKGSLCANWAAEGFLKAGGEIKGKYYNKWYYTDKHADDERDIFDQFNDF